MNRSELVKTLELVQPALADNNLVPISTCFLFKGDTVSAYNNDALGIVAPCEIGNTFASSGGTLIGLLKNSSGEDVEFELTKENVAISTGKSTFKLPFFTEEEFLFEEPDEKWVAAVLINADVLQSIAICMSTTSRDNTMPALMGVCFNIDKPATNFFSCDGDAITRCTQGSGKVTGKGVFTVPNVFCDALLKICSETETDQGKLDFSEGWVRASLNNGFTLYGRMIENNAPLDHEALIQKTMKGKITFVPIPMGLNEALSRARVVADVESAQSSLDVKGGKLKLTTDTKMGLVKDELSIRGHDDVTASVHASLVQRSIAVCDQIAIRENCTAYKLEGWVLQVVSNIGE